MKQVLKDNFDKVIILVLILIFGLPAVFGIGNLSFAQRVVDGLTGALLTLITQQVLRSNGGEPPKPAV